MAEKLTSSVIPMRELGTGKNGFAAKSSQKAPDVRGRRAATYRRSAPLPLQPTLCQRQCDYRSSLDMRGDGPIRERGDSEVALHHFDYGFSELYIGEGARRHPCGDHHILKDRELLAWNVVSDEVLLSKVFRRYKRSAGETMSRTRDHD